MSQPTCRGCGRTLIGSSYEMGGRAYHPFTKRVCRANYYGGWVCSEGCDTRACREMERSMPGAGPVISISTEAAARISKNWG